MEVNKNVVSVDYLLLSMKLISLNVSLKNLSAEVKKLQKLANVDDFWRGTAATVYKTSFDYSVLKYFDSIYKCCDRYQKYLDKVSKEFLDLESSGV